MSPVNASPNCGNGGFCNSETQRQATPGRSTVTDLAYLCFGKFHAWMLFACEVGLPSLAPHIPHVVGITSKKQMKRVNAKPHIAFMADTETFRDSSIGKNPSDAVSASLLAFKELGSVTAVSELSSSPKPALIRGFSFDLIPEPNFDRLVFSHDAPPVRNGQDRFGVSSPLRSEFYHSQDMRAASEAAESQDNDD